MTLEDVYTYYETPKNIINALGIARQSLAQWNMRGCVPIMQQLRLEIITNGELKADKIKNNKREQSGKLCLPNYRYFNETHGMCAVDSLIFYEARKTRIVYIIEGAKKRKVITFDPQYLMQATDLMDIDNKNIFVGDVVFSITSGNFIFDDLKKIDQLRDLDQPMIIGHIYDGVKYGEHRESC